MRSMKLRWFRKRTEEMVYDLITTVYPDGSFGPDEDSEWTVFAGQYCDLIKPSRFQPLDWWEGDIIKFCPPQSEDKSWFKIVWYQGAFAKEWVNTGTMSFVPDQPTPIEWRHREFGVKIGNIFENPELL